MSELSAPDCGGAPQLAPSRRSTELLLSLVHRQQAAPGCGRSPYDFVPHQLLAWEVEEALNNSNGGAQEAGARIVAGSDRRRQVRW